MTAPPNTAMDRSHLQLAYIFTWVIQLAYAAYVIFRLRRGKKDPTD